MTTADKPTWSDPGPSWRELQGGKLELDDAAASDWAELGRRRCNLRRAAILLAGWIPFSFVVALVGLGFVLLLGSDSETGEAVNNGTFLLSMTYMLLAYLWLIVARQRLLTWPCPICDRWFFEPSSFAIWPRGTKCAHCGANLPPWYSRR